MFDAALPPSAAAPHTDAELKRLRLFDGLDDEAVTDRKVAEMCGLDSLGRAVVLPELDYVRLRRAATRANRPPAEEHGRPSEWQRVVRELGDLKEAILAATGHRDPFVGRMLTTDQIVERVTRASRERAAALPPTEETKIPTDPHPSSNPHLDGWLPVEVDVAEVLNRQNRDRVDWYEIESMCRYILRVKAFRPMWAKRIAEWEAFEEAALRAAAPQQEERTPHDT